MSFWSGQSISEIGSRVTREGLPLAAVLSLGATPMTMGWLRLASALPVLVLGLVVGAYIDRFPRKPFLWVTDVLRFFVLLTVPLTALMGQLKMWMLFPISAVMGILTLIFTVAYDAYIPTLAGRQLLIDAHTKLSITQSFAEIVGPGLTGTLVQVMTAPFAMLLDALSYLVSAFTLLRIRTHEPQLVHSTSQNAKRQLGQEIAHGLHTIRHNRTLLVLAATAAISALFSGIVYTMDTVYAIRTLRLTAAVFGLTVTFGGVGALIGAALCQPLVRRIHYGWLLVMSAFLYGGFNWLIPLAHGPVWLAALFLIGAQLLGDMFGMVFEILEASLRQSLTDGYVLGRVNATINLLTSTLSPIGAILGGWLATVFNLRFAMAIGVAGSTAAALLLLLAPLANLPSLPVADLTGDGTDTLPVMQ